MKIKFILIASLFIFQTVLANSEFVDLSTRGCSKPIQDYLSEYSDFKKGSVALTALATIVNPVVGLGYLMATSTSHNQRIIVSALKVLALIQESYLTEDILFTELYEMIRKYRPEIKSVKDLKILFRAADEKKYFCRPTIDGLKTFEILNQELKSGILSYNELSKSQYSSIENQNALLIKNIPIQLISSWSRAPQYSMALFQYQLIKQAQYSKHLNESEIAAATEMILNSVSSNFVINEPLVLPEPLSSQSEIFWKNIFNNTSFLRLLKEKDSMLESKLRHYTKKKYGSPAKGDNRLALKEALIKQAKGEVSLISNYSWGSMNYFLILVKDIKIVNGNVIKVTTYSPFSPAEDIVLWFNADNGALYSDYNEAKNKINFYQDVFYMVENNEFLTAP